MATSLTSSRLTGWAGGSAWTSQAAGVVDAKPPPGVKRGLVGAAGLVSCCGAPPAKLPAPGVKLGLVDGALACSRFFCGGVIGGIGGTGTGGGGCTKGGVAG